MPESLLTIGSITHAMRGKELLGERGIKARVQRLSQDLDSDGCMQGLLIDSRRVTQSIELLRTAGIRVTHVREGGS